MSNIECSLINNDGDYCKNQKNLTDNSYDSRFKNVSNEINFLKDLYKSAQRQYGVLSNKNKKKKITRRSQIDTTRQYSMDYYDLVHFKDIVVPSENDNRRMQKLIQNIFIEAIRYPNNTINEIHTQFLRREFINCFDECFFLER